MSGEQMEYGGNLNEPVESPWPVLLDFSSCQEVIAARAARSKWQSSVAYACEKLLWDAEDVWKTQQHHTRMIEAGWRVVADGLPPLGVPVWVILRGDTGYDGERPAAWLTFYTGEDGWYDIADWLPVYWAPVTLPPLPAQIGWERD